MNLLGIASLPSTATTTESGMLLGATIAGAGVLLLRRRRQKN
ncbi:MAG TPA: LPXTG cell wall anchor domain-containing protein [Candidatus Udaeobacter sp.]|nr:LPXTG cell wall anchor domain-containing protein [Candidatus Udaeobacter sp.]